MTARGWYSDRTGARYVHVPLGAGKRKSMRLASTTDAEADARAKLVREIGAVLVAAGSVADVPDWTRKAAEGDDDRARRILAMARGLATGAERKAKGDQLTGTTFKEIADDWTSGRLAKRYPDQVPVKRTAGDDVSRLAFLTSEGGLGEIPITSPAWLDHAEEAMRRLPERCRTPATRRHYAQAIRRVLELAVYPLRLIPANPLPRGFLPKPKQVRALQMPYPDEEAALLGCADVDLAHRVAYGFLARMGFRKSEATGSKPGEEDPIPPLTWDRIDLDRGVVFMRRSKTEKARPLAMPADVTRALASWRELRPSHVHVFADAADAPLVLEARVFRSHLRRAGVTRAELHTKTTDSLAVRCHDLRALFVTTSLAQGRSETWIRDHTAHRTISMLDKYRRQARMFEELNLGPLAPLDTAIPEIAERVGATSDEGANGKDRKGGDQAKSPKNQADRAPERTDSAALGSGAARREGSTPSPCTNEGMRPSAERMSDDRPTPVRQDPVENALAKALDAAAGAGRFDVVAQLAKELEARRLANAANVVALEDRRRAKR